MPSKGTKKINASDFPKLKQLIEAKGIAAAADETGYSQSTLRAIRRASDYASWRGDRRSVSKTPKPTSKVAVRSTKAPAVSPIAKPAFQVNPPRRADDFVTKAQVEVALANVKADVTEKLRAERQDALADVLKQLKSIKKDVDELIEADTALRVAELEVRPKSFWQRIKEKF